MAFRESKRKLPTRDYLDKAALLSKKDTERLMSRMRGRFLRRFEDKRFSAVEALALQLEFEDEQLADWRKRIAEIRAKNAS